jgi:hypothetical protein
MMTDLPDAIRKRTTKSVASSSLLNALGGKAVIAKRGAKAHNSRFVIGADRQMKSVVSDPHMRLGHASEHSTKTESHPQQNDSKHASNPQHASHFFISNDHHMMTTDTHSQPPHHFAYSRNPGHHPAQHHYSIQSSQQQQHPDTHSLNGYAHNHFHTNPHELEVASTSHTHNNLQSPLTSYNPNHHTQRATTRTHIEIGRDERPTEHMEGVEDHSIKPPLVVLDGANVAHAYGKTLHSRLCSTEVQPDARGILVACEYFAHAQLRVLVVLPAHWFQRKNNNSSSATSDDALLFRVIEELDYQGILVPSPPSDDDDAYALTIAQRENTRAAQSHRHGPGYVLSNDMFRDAQNRDASGELKRWLTKGLSSSLSSHNGSSSLAAAASGSQDTGPGRISYTFCDMGRMDDHGERELDFIPNPRHPLIAWIESQRLTSF